MGHNPVLVRKHRRNSENGQAIVMVVLALFAMCGVLGLAVDFGWAYFVKRAAQGAADTAAIAAAEERRRITGFSGPYPCLNGGTCRDDSAPYVCLPSVGSIPADNLDNACLYARQNGFEEAGKQRVRISEGADGAPPTLPGVTLQYWATVRVTESVPQLFAAITGNPIATVSARATAGIYQGRLRGSIILLNRNNDVAEWGSGNPTGVNLEVQGSPSVTAGGGIFMASGCAGAGCPGNAYAGTLQGNSATVTAPFTSIRGTGDVSISGGNQTRWNATPVNGAQEGPEFQDPTRRLTQPPVSDAGLSNCPIDGGTLEPVTSGGTLNLGPGNYYSVVTNNRGEKIPTGLPIKFTGNINFRSQGSCLQGQGNAAAFGTYVIYGGLETKSGNGTTSLTFEPGAIVLAGVAPKNNGDANPLFDLSVGGSGFSLTGPGPSSAGNLFVFTDKNYPGLTNPIRQDPGLANLKQGYSGFKSGGNQNVSFTLDGLNENGAGIPPELKAYNSAVLWQDRRNSSVAYKPDGDYDCTSPFLNCTKSNAQQAADGMTDGSQNLFIAAGASTVIRGMIYQPRGAWATVQASPGLSAALQIVTGAMKVQGSGTVNLQPVTSALPLSIVGLVE